MSFVNRKRAVLRHTADALLRLFPASASASECVAEGMFLSHEESCRFACGMRESFEPEILIEDMSYETFHSLLEFLCPL